MSDVAFKKYCARGRVPVPARGYWAKLAAGKKVPRIPLPRREPGGAGTVHIGRPTYYGSIDVEELAKPLPEPPRFDQPLEVARVWAAQRLRTVKRVPGLDPVSPGVRKLLQQEAKRAERAKTDRYLFEWEKPAFESGFELRRLALLNSLGLGLARAGAWLEVSGRAGRSVHVVVGDTSVTLSVDHPKAKKNTHGEWPARPGPADTLKLVIGADASRTDGYLASWEDQPGRKLESRLTEIAVEIVVAGEVEYRAGALRRHEWALERRAELERERRRKIEETERRARELAAAQAEERRARLMSQAASWRSAQDIRGFVAEVLAIAASSETNGSLAGWAEWALREADALDPLKSGELM